MKVSHFWIAIIHVDVSDDHLRSSKLDELYRELRRKPVELSALLTSASKLIREKRLGSRSRGVVAWKPHCGSLMKPNMQRDK